MSNVLRNGEPYISAEEFRGVRGVDRMTVAEVKVQTGERQTMTADPGHFENFEFEDSDAYAPRDTTGDDFDGFTS